MLPPAPALFSTITLWPSVSVSDIASVRAMASVGPPGGKGTTKLMGRSGKRSASAAAGSAAVAASAQAHRNRRFWKDGFWSRSEEHTSELQSHSDLVCRLLLEKKKQMTERKRAKI